MTRRFQFSLILLVFSLLAVAGAVTTHFERAEQRRLLMEQERQLERLEAKVEELRRRIENRRH